VKDPRASRVECRVCGHPNPNRVTIDEVCGTPVELRLPYTVAEWPGARDDVLRAPEGHVPAEGLRQGERSTGKGAPKEWPIRDIKEEEVYFGEIP